MKTKSEKNRKKNRNKRKSSQQNGPKYWLTITAMGTLVAYSAFGSKTIGYAYPQWPQSASTAIHLQNQSKTPTHRFDIPPGSLDTVLNAFQNVTGWRVILMKDEIASISSPGVSGIYT